ncbi:MAG: hypothetical protein FWD03_02665 [Defluviitaleaceae bacterium]|nr:hypothetical protein [Defluviitaleaceae bacterium]
MKKYVIVFTFVMALALTACGRNAAQETTTSEPEITITIEDTTEDTAEASDEAPENNAGVVHQFDDLGFSVIFPQSWEGRFNITHSTFETEDGITNIVGVNHTATQEDLDSDLVGWLFSFGRTTSHFDDFPHGVILGSDETYMYFMTHPTDVQWNYQEPESASAIEYQEMQAQFGIIADSFRLIGGSNIQTPTDAEIEAAYLKAAEVFRWFDMTTMPHDWEDQIEDENGFTYVRITYDGINTLADLEAYLHNIFAPALVSDMFNLIPDRFRDFDGVLYAIGADRGGMLDRGDETHEIIRESNQRIIYRVTVDVLDWDTLEEVIDTVVYDFVYEFVDGKWVFSHFHLTN